MGSRGDAYDNALAETFWSTLDRELRWGKVFLTRAAARMALFDYIEGWFNNHRRHSSLGMLSPVEFERRWRADGRSVNYDHQVPACPRKRVKLT